MKITKCLHEILSAGYRVELAKADGSIYFLLLNPKRIPEPSGKLHFSIADELFTQGPEVEICKVLMTNFKKLKEISEG
ncbi:MAG: hypothetical protein KL787_04080 [Taibaiella sp.]|nr:hypothetical protein [Taibaiella sp.]